MSENELQQRAECALRIANGDDWDTMYSGDQEAEISAWIEGYKAAHTDNIAWLISMFNAAKSEYIADMDEVQHFIDWILLQPKQDTK